jgi:hypothetical protein
MSQNSSNASLKNTVLDSKNNILDKSTDNLRDVCVACDKTVYPAEKIVANNKVFIK